ncbi:MAG: hypothetical protein PHC51_13245 [bacterium]|nr:hypothetical protein [bacterium]
MRTPTREEKMSDAFYVIGCQYFALAAYCADRMYLPIAATLYHHAIEMLLKGFLAKSKTSDDLKGLGHNLKLLWHEFKALASTAELARYDTTIIQLNDIELLRYPDSIVDKGFVLKIGLGTPIPIDLPGTEGLPQYLIDVSDVNAIATAIFKAGNVPVTPYFKNTPSEMKRTLPASLQPQE